MSNLINNYPVFESSQVLTSSQLNRITSYLDQQNRLTRTNLIGMGIVCGFELGYDDSGGDLKITISKGTAITSEGFLITLGNCTTSWVRPYELPSGVAYAPFDNTDPSITLYEILAQEPDGDSDATPLGDDPEFLDDKFVLLFLEIFDNDLKACLGNTCDDLGIDRIFSIRKLLISKTDLDELLEHTSNVGHYFDDKYDLPDIAVPRTLFDPVEDHSKQYRHFTAHATESALSMFTQLFGSGATKGALHQTYTAYNALLGDIYDFENPFESQPVTDRINTWKQYVQDAADLGTDTHGIQYFSGFLNDLVLAYDEFRDVAFRLMSECCPDMSRFPRHVMLGRAEVESETPDESVAFRHGFTQPPIYNHQKQLIEESVSLHKRLLFLLRTFDLDIIRSPEEDPEREIHITPSNEKTGCLSQRSIPYYYDLDATVPGMDGTLETYWNYHQTNRKRTGSTPTLLSYHNLSEDQSEALNPAETPLYFNLDPYPFLRVEGHLGQDLEAVTNRIEELKKQFDLPFDLVSLQLDPTGDLLELDYSCGFEDLQERYASARRTYCSFIKDMMELLAFVTEHQDVLFDETDETASDLEDLKKILHALHTLCETMSECLHDFKFVEFQSRYKNSLALILDFMLIKKGMLDEIDVNEEDEIEALPIINGLILHMSPIVYRFTDILFYTTFLQIYESFKRREYYLRRETAIFSNYIKKHPGVKHQAGVPKGGTFILVHASDEISRVVADFSLPYTCCSSGRCVPMCDEDGDFSPELPPFARPDFAVTTIETPIEINVTENDFRSEADNIFIKEVQQESEGGTIKIISDEGLLQYSPNKDFEGVDHFKYIIMDKSTGLGDEGTVTVLVKESGDNQTDTCYPVNVLVCWTDGKRDKILDFYNRRHPNNPIDGDIPTIAAALHESLKESRGFTEEELDSLNPMEDTNQRRLMISCINPDVPVDNMKWDELGNWIREYQNKNCGPIQEEPLKECYNLTILDCWNGGNLALLVEYYNRRNPNNMITAESKDVVYNAVLSHLRQTNGFTQQDLKSGILGDDNQKRKLLSCLDIPFNENMNSKQLGDLILAYQNDNCGDGQVVVGEIPTIELKPAELSAKEIHAVLKARGIEVAGGDSNEKMLSALTSSTEGLRFTEEELMLFTKNRMTEIMKKRGLRAPAGSTKEKLVNSFMKGS